MTTKIKFANRKQYEEFLHDTKFIAFIESTWNTVLVFDSISKTVEFKNMSEESVMRGGVCLATCYGPDEITVVKDKKSQVDMLEEYFGISKPMGCPSLHT